jgi:alpha-beta hydrolase superfamily lysophospholipase
MRSKRRNSPFRRILTFLLVLGSGYLLLCFGLAKLYVNPPRSAPPTLKAFKRVTLPSGEPVWVSDGLQAGKPKGKALYILAHGYRGGIAHFNEMGKALIAKGGDVILTELSGHGDSPGASCEFGVKDADVLIEAARWAEARYAKRPRVVVGGVSMGGAAAWLATGKAPELFDAVVTEGAFAKLDEVTDSWFDRTMPEGHVVFWPVKFFASKLTGIDPSTVNPVDAAKKWKGKSALVIHCEADNLMRKSYSQDMAVASGGELWLIQGAEHAQGAEVAKTDYLAKLVALAANARAGH